MQVFTKEQLQEIMDIINRNIGVLIYITTGTNEVDPELLNKLGIPTELSGMIKDGFVLGKLAQIASESDMKNMTFEELKQKVSNMHLSTVEKNSLAYAEQNAATYVTALGQKVTTQLMAAMANAGQGATLASVEQDLIRDTVAQSVFHQKTRGELASDLGNAVGDWTRDWKRVAQTEIWNAKLNGEVVTILQGDSIYTNTEKGDTRVYRRPAPDACPSCKRLLLTEDGVTPRVFKLSQLISHGTNVGKRRAEWKPVVGTIHPNCTCPIAVLPEGFGFDENGQVAFQGL